MRSNSKLCYRTKEMNPTGHAHAQCSAGQSAVMKFFLLWHLSTALLTVNPLPGAREKR